MQLEGIPVEDWIGISSLILIVAGALLAWMFRIERILVRIARDIEREFSLETKGSFAYRIQRNSDRIRLLEEEMERNAHSLNILQILDLDPESLEELSGVLQAAAVIAKRNIARRDKADE